MHLRIASIRSTSPRPRPEKARRTATSPESKRIAIVFSAQRRKVERRFRHPWPASWRYFFAAFFKASFGAGGFRIASASCR